LVTNEEREQVLREARENMRLRDFPDAANVYSEPPPRVPEQYRREWTRPQPEPPQRERGLDTNQDLGRQAQWDASWNAWADLKIANALAAERTFVMECVGHAIGEMLEQEREEQKRALRLEASELRLELTKLRTLLAEHRALFATGDRSVLDLPNPLAAKRVN
jgi:hypothetical protein